MQIIGEWLLCPDGVSRPVVRAQVAGVAGRTIDEHFLVDRGADRTVFSADVAARLRLPVKQPLGSTSLVGIGSGSDVPPRRGTALPEELHSKLSLG